MPNRSTCSAREKQKNNYGAKTTVTRLSVLNTNVGASQRPSVVLPLFLISSPIPGIAKAAEDRYQVIDEEISGWARGEWDISFLEVLDSLPTWESTQSRESGFSNRPRNPSRQPI